MASVPTLYLGIRDISELPISRDVINFIGRKFEVWELLSVLDHRRTVYKNFQGNGVILTSSGHNRFMVKIIPISGDMMKLEFSADRICKLQSVLQARVL